MDPARLTSEISNILTPTMTFQPPNIPLSILFAPELVNLYTWMQFDPLQRGVESRELYTHTLNSK